MSSFLLQVEILGGIAMIHSTFILDVFLSVLVLPSHLLILFLPATWLVHLN